MPAPICVFDQWPSLSRFRTKTPSQPAITISSRPSPSKSMSWRLWVVCKESSATSDFQSSLAGSAPGVKTSTRTPRPSPQFGPFVPRPCKGATISCFLPEPVTSPQRNRWTVGSLATGKTSQGWFTSALRRSHWTVPPVFVFEGCQEAPRAKSILPSPSTSWGWMQTLSFSVAFLMRVCLVQDGLAYQ
ncbi:MAG: hypothetical protein LC745_10665 [Planctomycetia bacterium]|nr:hypothetical protein [Planctomycetia bacterium]